MRLAAALIIPIIGLSSSLLASENEGNQHEIRYGLDGLASANWVDLDISNFPFFGIGYKYYFEPISTDIAPFDIAADINRVSWAKIDLNVFTDFSPNIATHYYFNEQWSVEADLIFDRAEYPDDFSRSSREEIFVDVVANYQFSDKLQLGIGGRRFSVSEKYRTEISDSSDFNYSSSDVENVAVVQLRYTDIEQGKGWDHKGLLSTSDDFNTIKWSSTLYTSQQNGLTFGLVYYDEKSRSSGVDFNDNEDQLLTLSFTHKYWFSKDTAIDYGFSVNRIDGEHFTMLDINGVWRF